MISAMMIKLKIL